MNIHLFDRSFSVLIPRPRSQTGLPIREGVEQKTERQNYPCWLLQWGQGRLGVIELMM